jgi:hypothetical protein
LPPAREELYGHRGVLDTQKDTANTLTKLVFEAENKALLRYLPAEDYQVWLEECAIEIDIAKKVSEGLDTVLGPLHKLVQDLEKDRDMYRLKEIDQQVVAFEQLIIKARDDGPRKERTRALGAAITTISSIYSKLLTHLDADKVLEMIKEDLRDTAFKLEKELLYPSNNVTAA